MLIDPHRTLTANRADLHLQPRPGSDAALALSMMHVLFDEERVDRAWAALEQSHGVLFAVLRAHANRPEATAHEKAEDLGRVLGEPFTPNRFRVMLHRAREKFSMLLEHEVATSLGNPTAEELRDELRKLRLLRYCGH